jgi:hypothetical protein
MYAMREFRKPLNSLKKIWTIEFTRYEGRGTRYEGRGTKYESLSQNDCNLFYTRGYCKNKGANLIFFLSILA